MSVVTVVSLGADATRITHHSLDSLWPDVACKGVAGVTLGPLDALEAIQTPKAVETIVPVAAVWSV
jgi:hypothetical protein